jgi:hypothetical protein
MRITATTLKTNKSVAGLDLDQRRKAALLCREIRRNGITHFGVGSADAVVQVRQTITPRGAFGGRKRACRRSLAALSDEPNKHKTKNKQQTNIKQKVPLNVRFHESPTKWSKTNKTLKWC